MRSITLAWLLTICSAWRGWAQEAQVQLIFLDVGQGDAIVVRSPEGKIALVDSGNDGAIVYQLQALGIDSIDIAIASHPHADHIGGMAAVLRNFPVRYYMDNGVPHTTATYRELLRTVSNSDITYLQPTARTIELGSVRIHVFPPMERATNLNNQSVGLLIEHGEFEAWLSGDSEIEELNHFLSLGVPSVDVLKAAHHGSRDAVSPGWLSATKPDAVVISVGLDNTYGHPDPWAMRYYDTASDFVYRTDHHGQVTIHGNLDGTFEVTTGRTAEASVVPERPSPEETPTPAANTLALWVFADAPGNDHYNLNGEYVVLSNHGNTDMGIGGWTLCDAASHCFTFPRRSLIAPGGHVTVYTGPGTNDGQNFFMNRRQAVWNNRGDIATLTDSGGNLVVRYVY
ncbi:MAG: lamin tail domain-containing protein [Gemmatimonadetes bacterium]|nr:lamin tail domain-containing protein [Gemmatimonadota bacterium]